MASLVVPTTFTAIDKMSAAVKAMGANISRDFVSKAESGLNKIDRISKKLIPGLGAAAKQFLAFASTAAITAAIIGGLNFSYDAIKEYDKSVGSLLAVTGLTKEEFKPFGVEIARVAKVTKSSSIDVAKAMETIGSANSELLASADAMGKMTSAAITLSQASGDDLQETAGNLVGIMNQFKLGANSATMAMDALAAGTLVGAATIPQVAMSMKNFGAVANGANVTIGQSVALIETLAIGTIKGAEAGTALRTTILRLQAAGVGYKTGQFSINEALDETKKKIEKLKTAKEKDMLITKMFGAEGVTAAKVLLSNIDKYKEWSDVINGPKGVGQASLQAAKQNDTLSVASTQLKNKWITLITTNNELSTGTNLLKDAIKFLTDNLEEIIKYIAIGVTSWLALRAAIIISRVSLIAYNVTVGIYNALFTTSLVLTNQNILAQRAYAITSKIAVIAIDLFTGAQWLLNAAMTANPIGVIVMAIAALVAVVIIAIAKYNEWGASLLLLMGPLGWIINLIQAFRRNWDMITQSFAQGGILAGIKAIGAVILDSVLMPLEQILSIISKVTGADWASKAATDIAKFRKGLDVNVTTDENGNQRANAPLINNDATKAATINQLFSESVQRQNVAIDIKTDQQNTKVKSDNNLAKVNLKSTMGL
jgi:TP901 family phage tail tape measure protein